MSGYTFTSEGGLGADPLGFLDAGRASTLEQAVIVSLYTDRHAGADDALPDSTGNRRGWYGDAFAQIPGDEIGSKLWLLRRGKPTAETVAAARGYAEAALAWLVAEGIATSVEVAAERQGLDRVAVEVKINRAAGGPVVLRFAELWS